MKYLQNITSNKKFNNYRPLVAYDAEEDKLYYLPFENMLPFTIIAVSDITVSMSHNVIQYSYDGLQWQDLPVGDSFSVSAGDKVYVQCSSPSVSSSYGMGTFSIEGTFRIAGNIMSLVNGDNYNTDYTHKANQFRGLFKSNTGLLDASELILPATTLAEFCYCDMFSGCTSLVNAPELPATTLAKFCYNNMFYNCILLVTAPELPATTLEDSCYLSMFNNCTSLVTAPELPATTLAYKCYSLMFVNCTSLTYIKALFTTNPSTTYTSSWVDGVSSNGTFVKNSAATWDVVGTSAIPEGWTVETTDA